MLILNLMICIQYKMTQLIRERPVPESQTVWWSILILGRWSRPVCLFYSTLRNTFSHFSFAPDLSLISHSSTTSTPIRTLAVRHCISKWNISKQIYYTLLHLYSTEACFFFFGFSLCILQEVFLTLNYTFCVRLKSSHWCIFWWFGY